MSPKLSCDGKVCINIEVGFSGTPLKGPKPVQCKTKSYLSVPVVVIRDGTGMVSEGFSISFIILERFLTPQPILCCKTSSPKIMHETLSYC